MLNDSQNVVMERDASGNLNMMRSTSAPALMVPWRKEGYSIATITFTVTREVHNGVHGCRVIFLCLYGNFSPPRDSLGSQIKSLHPWLKACNLVWLFLAGSHAGEAGSLIWMLSRETPAGERFSNESFASSRETLGVGGLLACWAAWAGHL